MTTSRRGSSRRKMRTTRSRLRATMPLIALVAATALEFARRQQPDHFFDAQILCAIHENNLAHFRFAESRNTNVANQLMEEESNREIAKDFVSCISRISRLIFHHAHHRWQRGTADFEGSERTRCPPHTRSSQAGRLQLARRAGRRRTRAGAVAGSGALSLDCLSRGAASTICVEKSHRHAEFIRTTRAPPALKKGSKCGRRTFSR